jgi:hypothetical protein
VKLREKGLTCYNLSHNIEVFMTEQEKPGGIDQIKKNVAGVDGQAPAARTEESITLNVEETLESIELQLSQGQTEGTGKYRFGIQGDIELVMGWAVGYKVETGLTQRDRLKWLIRFLDADQGKLKGWLEERVIEVFDSIWKKNKEAFSPQDAASLMALEQAVQETVQKAHAEPAAEPLEDYQRIGLKFRDLNNEKIRLARQMSM